MVIIIVLMVQTTISIIISLILKGFLFFLKYIGMNFSLITFIKNLFFLEKLHLISHCLGDMLVKFTKGLILQVLISN